MQILAALHTQKKSTFLAKNAMHATSRDILSTLHQKKCDAEFH